MRGLGAGARYSRAHRARSPLGTHIGRRVQGLVKFEPVLFDLFFSSKATIRPGAPPRRVPPAVATRTPTHCLQAPSHFEQAAAGRRRCPPHARDREEREAALNEEKK